MKHLLFLTLLFLGCNAIFASEEKSEIPLADPYILYENGIYYAYGTHSADGIEVYKSTDLKSWTLEGLALNKTATTEKQWFWAPEVYKFDDLYYMYYSANEHLFVATSTSPTGPFKQKGAYLMGSVLGNEKCIDSSVFTDDDGTQYIFFVRFTDGNCIWSCRLESDHVTPVGSTLRKCINVSQAWETKLGRVTEGPFIVKNPAGKYIMSYSGNDFQSQDYGVGCAVTSNIATGVWSKYAENPIVHNVENLVGCGHHSFFTDKEGKMRIVFHAHNDINNVHPRCMYIGTMEYSHGHLRLGSEEIIRPVLNKNISAIEDVSDDAQRSIVSVSNIAGQPASTGDKLTILKYNDGSSEKRLSARAR